MFLYVLIMFGTGLYSSIGMSISAEKEIKTLPPIYEIMDYQQCMKDTDNEYCISHIQLKPIHTSSKIWSYIEKTKTDDFLYNHDKIYRAMCIPKVFKNNPKYFIESAVNSTLKQIDLASTVERVTCKEPYYPTALDNLLLIILIGYLSFVIAATLFEYKGENNGQTVTRDVLTAFSLRRNYKKMFNTSIDSHYQKLKCIQGLRTIICVHIIWTHTKFSFLFSFVEDTKYVEEIFYWMFYVSLTFDSFMTQIFSLVSAWLLTVQVMNVFKVNEEFTLTDVSIIIINRICRLWPMLIVFVIYVRQSITNLIKVGAISEATDECAKSCEKYWWRSLVFVQNYFESVNICNLGFWFISTDLQMYVLCIVLLYIILKFRWTKTILGISLFISYGLFGIVIYFNRFDVVYRFYPENLKWVNFFYDTDKSFRYLYTMSHVSMSTYVIGICFGIYYYNHHQGKNKQALSVFFIIVSCALPILAVFVATKKFKGIPAALVGPLLKPIYSFGIGLGILNIIQSEDGIVKRILEWRPLEFLSQVTYSTYILHFIVVCTRIIMNEPLAMSFLIIVTAYMHDAIFGFFLGFLGYIFIELPWSNIQKKYVPQIKKRHVQFEKHQ